MPPSLPLSDIKVIEFTHAVMGPSCGLILADLGANVIRIEPVNGDPTRKLKGFGVGYYPFYNRNKKSIAVNIKSPEGKEIIEKLIPKMDVLVENFGPGTMDRLGYGYNAVQKINSRLIYASLKGFLTGPYENRHAMDEVVQMMGGLAYMTGPSGRPTRAGASVIDVTGGLFGVIGILTAVHDREKTGKGCFVKSALFETCAFLMGQHMAYSALIEGEVPPMPERISAWAVYQIFDTQDSQQIFVGIISEKHWAQFCNVFNRNDLLEDFRLKTNNNRIEEREWLLPEIESMMKKLSKDDIIHKCKIGGIPYAPIAKPEELFDDPQLNSGNGLIDTVFPDGTQTKMPRIPLEYGDSNFELRHHPPKNIGMHGKEILMDLDYTESDLSLLKEQKIINY
ncbi:MAG: CoA transferase [Candidatus Marinimicrobia bacterium]|jgi:crotonobetainyl-CoA:carnitine CoA-transferase CaiB-like acyl-CoA transferase|nr:CoA transferase [Candidatus Neomarinimicrobiota bacterium]MBT3497207.1 CoA transferase [Candidatus Neomarinimicrobiota bacterium]MBT3692075.1 CoA transferase [Candidatus Neomarinimicrobiota bacterium]MBT3732271.1 CoA transferase [Candidatus Neomarinimicrobiota bacterium]MBT4143684.1 CoA transferase [Candidatus Neomarinimicrobiota bacterium]